MTLKGLEGFKKMAKTIRRAQIRKALNIIADAHSASLMKTVCFAPSAFDDTPLPKNESEVNQFIKDKTELFRETWISSPLNTAINILINELHR